MQMEVDSLVFLLFFENQNMRGCKFVIQTISITRERRFYPLPYR
jgi:hypothetical protein